MRPWVHHLSSLRGWVSHQVEEIINRKCCRSGQAAEEIGTADQGGRTRPLLYDILVHLWIFIFDNNFQDEPVSHSKKIYFIFIYKTETPSPSAITNSISLKQAFSVCLCKAIRYITALVCEKDSSQKKEWGDGAFVEIPRAISRWQFT